MSLDPAPPHALDHRGAGDEGVAGNARLTAANGIVLTVLLLGEGVTILNVRGMITLHMFLGALLIGPVLLKTASTVYRFARYYQGAAPYRRKGPPHMVLRVLGPLVILSSLTVLGSGFGLLAVDPNDPGLILNVHQVSFVIWLVVLGVHFLAHIKAATVETWHELRPDTRAARAARAHRLRLGLITLALIIGVGVATAVLPIAALWMSYP